MRLAQKKNISSEGEFSWWNVELYEERRGGKVLEEGYNPSSILLPNYPCKGIRNHKQSGENKQCSLRSRTDKTNNQKHVPTTFLVRAEILSFVRLAEC